MRKLIVGGVTAGALLAGLAPVQASPYDAVLAEDFAHAGPVEALLQLIEEALSCRSGCKREWVINDPTMAVGTYTITQGPNGKIVTAGVGTAGVTAALAQVERVITNGMDEYTLVLTLAERGKDIKRDLDGDGDVDLVWDRQR